MSITILPKYYVQKSRMFLYPALDIRRGVSVTPTETYTSWEGQFSQNDMKYCCLYHLRDDTAFKAFEKDKLLGNRLFYDYKEVEDNKGVYIFDYKDYAEDWKCFTLGKYSKISESHKKKIKSFYGNTSPNYPYIESFLYPAKYFRLYSHLMGVKESMLKEVGELCDKPNLESETLKASVKNLHFTKEMR